jgi:hypothetical protein
MWQLKNKYKKRRLISLFSLFSYKRYLFETESFNIKKRSTNSLAPPPPPPPPPPSLQTTTTSQRKNRKINKIIYI